MARGHTGGHKIEVPETASLTLVRANKSGGGGHWSDDDYDVYAADHAASTSAQGSAVVLDDNRARTTAVTLQSRQQRFARTSDGRIQGALARLTTSFQIFADTHSQKTRPVGLRSGVHRKKPQFDPKMLGMMSFSLIRAEPQASHVPKHFLLFELQVTSPPGPKQP